jgi:hypothetical protein
MVVQSSKEAKDNANRYKVCARGMCLKYVRTWLEIGSQQPSAIAAWNAAKKKHAGDRNPPGAAPCFFAGGKYGHIELTFSDVNARGTDMPGGGLVSTQVIEWCEKNWGYKYLGWTEDLNGVDIPYLSKDGQKSEWASGKVYVKKLKKGQKDSDSVARLCYRLRNMNNMPGTHKPPKQKNDYGQELLEAVRYWQKNLGGKGVKGPDDGTSLSNQQANKLFGDNYEVIEK